MFGNFSGQTRRPRQVNLSGRKNQPPKIGFGLGSSTAYGAQSTIHQAQLERAQRNAEKRKTSAVHLVQRVWRGRKSAERTRWQFQDEWDEVSGYLRFGTTPEWTVEDTIRNSRLFLAFFNRKGPLSKEELLRAGYLCKKITSERRDEKVDYYSKRVFKMILCRMETFVLLEGLMDKDHQTIANAIGQVIKFLGRNGQKYPELVIEVYSPLTLSISRSTSYYSLLAHLTNLSANLPTRLQSLFTTPAIVFAALSPLHSTYATQQTSVVVSRDFATKFVATEDLPRLLASGDGYPTLCKDPKVFEALAGEKEYTIPETYKVLDIDKQLWLLSTIIHITRLGTKLSLGSRDIEYLGFLSTMLASVSKEVARRIDVEDLSMSEGGGSAETRPQPLPAFVREQLQWLCQKSTISTLLHSAAPLGTVRGIKEARILASYALTLILLFPSKRQDLRMWLCLSTTSDGTPALQYFWKAARSTDAYKKVSESSGDRNVVRMLKTKLRSEEETAKRDRDWCIVFLFLELYSLMLTVMDDDDFFSGQNREIIKGTKGAALPIGEVVDLSVFLKNLGFGVYWHAMELLDDPANPQGAAVFENDKAGETTSLIGLEGMTVNYVKGTVTSLLKQLYLRDSRRKFTPADHWLMTSHFEMDGFISAVVKEEEDRRWAEMEKDGESDDEDEQDLSITPVMHTSIQRQARNSFLSSIAPRLDIVQNLPFFIPFETRVQIFREFVALDRLRRKHGPLTSREQWNQILENRIRNQGRDDNDLPPRGSRHHGTIRRERLFEDALKEFYDLGEALKEPIQITFIDKFGDEEAGIDGGGVTKEFLTSVTKEAFVPSDEGLFCENKDHFLFPNPASILAVRNQAKDLGLSPEETQEQVKEVLKRYEFLGRVVGKCLYEGILLEIGFAGFFLLKWAFKGAANDGYRPSVNDLRDLDEDLYNGMITLKNYPGDVEHELFIDFTHTTKVLGKNHTVELRPNGHNIPVTNANRLEYIHLVSRYHLQVQSEPQTNAFLRGLGLIIRPAWLAMFNQVELQILVAGDLMNAIDVDDLRRHTNYGGIYQRGYDEFGRIGEEHQVIKWFWEVMYEFSDENRRKVLKFVTSVSRAPLLGFKALQPSFSIRDSTSTGPMGETDRLPSASTCVNLLKLPRYKDKATLRNKLMYAVNAGAGFDLS